MAIDKMEGGYRAFLKTLGLERIPRDAYIELHRIGLLRIPVAHLNGDFVILCAEHAVEKEVKKECAYCGIDYDEALSDARKFYNLYEPL